MSASIAAPLAGGRVTVRAGVLPATHTPVVVLNVPAVDSPLAPDEARTLARMLLEFAAAAERPAGDDWPDEEV